MFVLFAIRCARLSGLLFVNVFACSLRVCIWLVINDAMLCGVFFVLLCLNV